MDGKGPLEVGHDFVIAGGVPVGEHDEALDRRTGAARIVDRQRDTLIRLSEHRIGIAIAERAIADDVAPDCGMQDRCVSRGRLHGIYYCRQLSIIDADSFEGVFSQIPIGGQHHRHRLPHEAHPLHRQAPVLHGLLDADHEGPGPAADIGACDHRGDTRHGERRACVDSGNLRMGVG